MEDFWSMICGDSVCSETVGKPFCYDFKFLKEPLSSVINLMIICFDVLLLIMMSFVMIWKSSLRPLWVERYSNLQLVSVGLNGSTGLLHLCLGIWVLEEKLRKTHISFLLSWWLPELFQGLMLHPKSLTGSN